MINQNKCCRVPSCHEGLRSLIMAHNNIDGLQQENQYSDMLYLYALASAANVLDVALETGTSEPSLSNTAFLKLSARACRLFVAVIEL
jgi:hypothetical protein